MERDATALFVVIYNQQKRIQNTKPCGEIPQGFSYALTEVKHMPRKPKRPCSFPGCPNLVEAGMRFCPEHEKEENRRYEKYGRDRTAKRRYGRGWKRVRDHYIAAHPLCEQCMKEGRLTRATQVHHIVPLSEGGSSRPENLTAICSECHARIHAKRGDRWHTHGSREGRSES